MFSNVLDRMFPLEKIFGKKKKKDNTLNALLDSVLIILHGSSTLPSNSRDTFILKKTQLTEIKKI